jgi:hypothetical protein
MPTRAPRPTAARGGHFVNSSASGPIPTSRYCDHMPWATSTSLTRVASGEPGRRPRRSGPMIAWISRRTPSAMAGFPRARSSMTRSSRLDTNVTPLALTACRSHGARSHGLAGSRCPSALLATRSSRGPRGGAVWITLRTSAGVATFRRWLTVGYNRVRSTASWPRTAMTEGPPSAGTHARPISKASPSLGTHSRADSLLMAGGPDSPSRRRPVTARRARSLRGAPARGPPGARRAGRGHPSPPPSGRSAARDR